MAASPGYLTKVKKGGTPTSFTGETFTNTSGNIWKIDDATKQVFDRNGTFTFYDNSTPISASEILYIDYLFGLVEFSVAKVGPITADGGYVPLAEIIGAKDYSITMNTTILDQTDFSNVGYRDKTSGLFDSTVAISRWDDSSKAYKDILTNKESVFIEINPGQSNTFFRGWFLLESDNTSGDIDALEEEALDFTLDGDGEYKSFSYRIVT